MSLTRLVLLQASRGQGLLVDGAVDGLVQAWLLRLPLLTVTRTSRRGLMLVLAQVCWQVSRWASGWRASRHLQR